MKIFNRKSNMWDSSLRLLSKELLEVTKQSTHKDYVIEQMVEILKDYHIYEEPERQNSNVLWRLSSPVFYLVGFICFILLSPYHLFI